MVVRSSGFFRAPANNTHKQGGDYEYINVGSEQFHAVAVALIDYLQNGSPASDATLKKILGRFYQYFPQYLANDAYLTTPKERMGRLLSNSRKSELVECMAYVLRQLTVDELYADHLNLAYRSVFADLAADTPKSYLRDTKTLLPAAALKALARSLDTPIVLSYQGPYDLLRKREGAIDAEQPTLTLLVQGDKYYPRVMRKADFAYVGQLAISAKPEVLVNEAVGEMAEMVNAITERDRKLLHAYEQQRHVFLNMVAAGELSYSELLDLYISFLPMDEHNAAFIRQLEQDAHPVISAMPVGSQQQTIQLLAGNLSSWIVAGAVDKDKLFEHLENNQPKPH